jgi:hypothetical protein
MSIKWSAAVTQGASHVTRSRIWKAIFAMFFALLSPGTSPALSGKTGVTVTFVLSGRDTLFKDKHAINEMGWGHADGDDECAAMAAVGGGSGWRQWMAAVVLTSSGLRKYTPR